MIKPHKSGDRATGSDSSCGVRPEGWPGRPRTKHDESEPVVKSKITELIQYYFEIKCKKSVKRKSGLDKKAAKLFVEQRSLRSSPFEGPKTVKPPALRR
jgi:hypothetical protein